MRAFARGVVLELKKRKYKKKEVETLVSVFKITYEARIAELKNSILQQSEEILSLKTKLLQYEDKENILNLTIEEVEKVVSDTHEKMDLQYSLELERLKQFSSRWEKYLDFLKEKYPLYQPIITAVEVKEKIDGLNENDDPKDVIIRLDEKLIKQELDVPFNPKQKIKDYIAATGDNGFNLDEVLNPGELELEELCKELGLIDGEE